MARALKVIQALSVRWLWVYIAALALFAFSIAGWYEISAVPPLEQVLNYHTMVDVSGTIFRLSLTFFVSGWILRIIKQRKPLSGIVLFALTSICAILILAFVGPVPYPLTHVDDQYLTGRRYNLESYPFSDFGIPTGNIFAEFEIYVVYECDSLNIRCTPLFHESVQWPIVHPSKAFLVVDADQLSVSINEAIVYTYHPS